jgi:hypothetical protein
LSSNWTSSPHKHSVFLSFAKLIYVYIHTCFTFDVVNDERKLWKQWVSHFWIWKTQMGRFQIILVVLKPCCATKDCDVMLPMETILLMYMSSQRDASILEAILILFKIHRWQLCVSVCVCVCVCVCVSVCARVCNMKVLHHSPGNFCLSWHWPIITPSLEVILQYIILILIFV